MRQMRRIEIRSSAAAIRDGERWRMRYNYATFEQYCEERWDLQKAHAYRLMDAAEFAAKVSQRETPIPSSERHIRPLLERLETDDDRIAVWRDVLATTNGARIKASDVDHAITRFLAFRNKEYVTLEEWREIDETGRAADAILMCGIYRRGSRASSSRSRRSRRRRPARGFGFEFPPGRPKRRGGGAGRQHRRI
jgi:hypothetical protein